VMIQYSRARLGLTRDGIVNGSGLSEPSKVTSMLELIRVQKAHSAGSDGAVRRPAGQRPRKIGASALPDRIFGQGDSGMVGEARGEAVAAIGALIFSLMVFYLNWHAALK